MNCNNCGHPTNGARYCPYCGADQYQSQGGDLGGGALVLLFVALFVLPIAVFNPLVMYKYIWKDQRFPSVSDTGRRVAFWSSCLYSGWMVLMAVLSSMMPATFISLTGWPSTVTGFVMVIIGVAFLYAIIRGSFMQRRIKRGILQLVGLWGFMTLIAISIAIMRFLIIFMLKYAN